MTFDIALSLFAIVVLIALSAFFNVSETALTAASRARMHALDEDGNKKAKLVNRLLASPEKMIGTVLLGNTLVDVLAAALASNLAVRLYGEVGVAYATGDRDAADRHFRRCSAEDLCARLFGPRGARHCTGHARRHLRSDAGHEGDRVRRAPALEADAHQGRRRSQYSRRARGNPRHHRPAGQGRRRHQGSSRNARRRARSARSAGRRHHGAPHQDGHHLRRRPAGKDRRRDPEEPEFARADLEGRARKHRRRAAYQGPAGGARRAPAGIRKSSRS